MVKFRCKRSGNYVSFSNPEDIAGLRKHEGYEEVKDETQEKTVQEADAPRQEVLKKRGRPRK
jgi:hypothetical protein